MARVTALTSAKREHVLVELEGVPWRTLRLEVVARTRLQVGEELDRPRLRELRREILRTDAVSGAVAALRRRDLSAADLDERLARRGVAASDRDTAIETLTQVGYVDDGRVALTRAQTLAQRQWGNVAIDADLERSGIAPDLRAHALAELEPERERADRILAARGLTQKTLGFLGRKGFGEDTLEAAADALGAREG